MDGRASRGACTREPRAPSSAGDAASGLTTRLWRRAAVTDSMLEPQAAGEETRRGARAGRCGVERRSRADRAGATAPAGTIDRTRTSDLLLRLDACLWPGVVRAVPRASFWATVQRPCEHCVACRASCAWPRPSGRLGRANACQKHVISRPVSPGTLLASHGHGHLTLCPSSIGHAMRWYGGVSVIPARPWRAHTSRVPCGK